MFFEVIVLQDDVPVPLGLSRKPFSERVAEAVGLTRVNRQIFLWRSGILVVVRIVMVDEIFVRHGRTGLGGYSTVTEIWNQGL